MTRSKADRGVRTLAAFLLAVATCGAVSAEEGPVLDKRKLLEAQSFWDNRDWDWYERSIPFFESPDPDLDTTYYYRWELVTKHLTYGSPASGYSFTEFIDRPFWSGAYGAISCPAGHQLYETRWLRDPRPARDYARYWFRTPGAQPRNYSTWLADAVHALHLVHPNPGTADLLPDLVANYEGWEKTHFDREAGLFWQTGHDDGMEFNINSRQTTDILRGAPAYRPTLNAYLWADARAIAAIARLAGDAPLADRFAAKADALKANLQRKLWDPKRQFFFPMARRDETLDGSTVKAGSLTYQTGKFAGDPHGRELVGYVPWAFGLLDPGFEAAWKPLMDPDGFQAPFGPTVTERHDPLFLVTDHCCWWSGQSWPYATTQTLVALANLLNSDCPAPVTKADYARLLGVYARTHRKGGRPYLAEGANPDTGSFEGYNAFNHSEHYFYSGFVDPVVTGLASLRPRADDTIEVNPLAPESWDYFALDDVPYRDHRIAILWDRDGRRYGKGPGLRILVDGRAVATSPTLGRITAPLPPAAERKPEPAPPINYAVNNDGTVFPRADASFTAERTSVDALCDGNYWYSPSPPNRWTAEGSPSDRDWCSVDFGINRRVDTVKLYLLDDDGGPVSTPARIDLESWDGSSWVPIPGQSRIPAEPTGHRANVITFAPLETSRLRATLTHGAGSRSGLTEFEAWGSDLGTYAPAPPPPGNLAVNPSGQPFPAVSASFTSPHDKVSRAIDGLRSFRPVPNNRWTTWNSPNESDWLALDFGREQDVGRVDLYFYDDGGGVQAPRSYTLQRWDGSAWVDIPGVSKTPARPAGGRINTVTFPRLSARKLRVVFEHAGPARSGLTEIEVRRD